MIDMGYLDEETLWKVLEEQKRSGTELLGKVAVRMGLVKEDQVLKALGEQLGMKVVKLADVTIPAELTELVNESMATAYKIVPISQNKKDKSLTVAMAEPQNPSTLDSLKMFLSTEVKGAIADRGRRDGGDRAALRRPPREHPGRRQADRAGQGPAQSMAGRNENTIDLEAIEEMAEAAPVRKLLNMVLAAGDQGQGLGHPLRAVRGRVQDAVPGRRGALRAGARRRGTWPRRSPAASRSCPTSTSPSGGCRRTAGSSSPWAATRSTSGSRPCPPCSARASCCGSSTARSCSSTSRSWACPTTRSRSWHEIIEKPNGIVLVTGPTSSGKTTTLYATLNHLNRIEDKIITTEEPVEYDIEGLIQIPVNPDIGVTFAACLRSILRQDPDKILVGETRDLETAEISIQASLTGHIVFTTLAHQRRPLGDHPAPRHGPAHVLDHGHRRGGARPAAGAQDLHQLPHRVHPGPRGLHGAGHDRRAGRRPRSSTTARAARSATTPATRAGRASTSSWS